MNKKYVKILTYLFNFCRNIYRNFKNTMNTLVQSTGGQWPLINLTGDYITFDVGEKKKQRVKIVGTHKHPYFCGRDVCEILGYVDVQKALATHVKPKHKKILKH